MTYWLGDVHYNHWARALTEFFNLKPSDDEVEEERDDGEQVDEVHRRHEELQLARGARKPDLKRDGLLEVSTAATTIALIYF